VLGSWYLFFASRKRLPQEAGRLTMIDCAQMSIAPTASIVPTVGRENGETRRQGVGTPIRTAT